MTHNIANTILHNITNNTSATSDTTSTADTRNASTTTNARNTNTRTSTTTNANSGISNLIRTYLEVSSTQDIMTSAYLRGAPHLSAVTTQQQSKGRGSHWRIWHSPQGTMSLSVLLCGIKTAQASVVLHSACLAALSVCADIINPASAHVNSPSSYPPQSPQNERQSLKQSDSGLCVGFKWPNDLVLFSSPTTAHCTKIGGLLMETMNPRDDCVDVILGIGMNITAIPRVKKYDTHTGKPSQQIPSTLGLSLPWGCLKDAVSSRVPHPLDPTAIADQILMGICHTMFVMQQGYTQGTAVLNAVNVRRTLSAHLWRPSTPLIFHDGRLHDDDTPLCDGLLAHIIGLDIATGALIVRTPDGVKHCLTSSRYGRTAR